MVAAWRHGSWAGLNLARLGSNGDGDEVRQTSRCTDASHPCCLSVCELPCHCDQGALDMLGHAGINSQGGVVAMITHKARERQQCAKQLPPP